MFKLGFANVFEYVRVLKTLEHLSRLE